MAWDLDKGRQTMGASVTLVAWKQLCFGCNKKETAPLKNQQQKLMVLS